MLSASDAEHEFMQCRSPSTQDAPCGREALRPGEPGTGLRRPPLHPVRDVVVLTVHPEEEAVNATRTMRKEVEAIIGEGLCLGVLESTPGSPTRWFLRWSGCHHVACRARLRCF